MRSSSGAGLAEGQFKDVSVLQRGVPLTRPARTDLNATFEQAAALHDAGRLREAEQLYQTVLKSDRDHFDALCRLGVLRLQQTAFEDAIRLFRRAIRQDRHSAEALQYLAFAQTGRGQHEDAIRSYQKALAVRPDFPEAYNNLGHTLQMMGREAEAMAAFERALALRPEYPEARNNLGNVLHVLDRSSEAIAHYQRAIALLPKYAEAYWNLGNALRAVNRLNEAIASYEKAIAIKPGFAEAFNSLANTLRILGRHEESIPQYEKAIAAKPEYVEARLNLSRLLLELGRHAEVIVGCDAALRFAPTSKEAWSLRGQALAKLMRHPEAVISFENALAIDPTHAAALEGLVQSAVDCCDWKTTGRCIPQLIEQAARGAPVAAFSMLLYCDDPALHLATAERSVRKALSDYPIRVWTGQVWRSPKIRLAYVASGFHRHPTAYLSAELFEIHDRSRFDVLGFSTGPDDQSEIRARIIRGFDEFHDVRDLSDEEVARLIHDRQVDIVIDRSGYTANSRMRIFAHRPAPIQVNYIGYPGSLGADFYDYVLADRTVLPFDQQQFYVERIVHLPDSYLVHDSQQPIAAETPSRREVGLPERGFVFCCFNGTRKLTPQMFDIWMRLLRQVDGSALWLLRTHPETEQNLAREAVARGVDPSRLVFAGREALDRHLARHRLADLFLDTLPYNAHTTASDALWAGLPLVTCPGRAFATRVAASLLYSIGLPELVTSSLEEYEALALRLATDPSLLQGLRDRLAANRLTYPLFNSDRYRRGIEAAYTTMWEIWQRGETPRNFAVPPG